MSLMVDQTWRDQAGSPDRFGYEWGAYGDLLPEYEEQFRGWTVHLARADWRGLSFLDVGCGMGRNSSDVLVRYRHPSSRTLRSWAELIDACT
jgi:hypothetical protein